MAEMQEPNAERKAFYDTIDGQNMTPLWEVLDALVTPEPVHSAVPAIWHYADIRPHIMASR